ncbi:unnamed protein product [Toxocara canis]|uniref:Mitochondrial inner membrane protein Mpv17 n=1 Tax=Toxocara canis TaxID=6265 RepID=A0A183UC30_TOXCA|nr:unnamed protein product [Toxocara canis]
MSSLAGVGDAFSQLVVEERWRKGGYDAVRTARFVGVISVWVAPILYRWFGVLERVSGRASIVPMKRMLIDQAVMAPCLTSTVITGLHLVEGNKPRDALLRARREIVPVLITNYKARSSMTQLLQVWPFVQLFNFYVVPLRYRIVLLQFVGIFWNAYLSFMTQSAQSAMRSESKNSDEKFFVAVRWPSFRATVESVEIVRKRGILGLCGDGISQKLVEKRRWDEYDPARAARFLTITGAYIAPVLVCWFRILERVTGNPKTVPLKRLFIDQYWPFVQMANFYVVPLNYRVIVVQVAALLWNTFLSYRTQAASAASASQAVKKVSD